MKKYLVETAISVRLKLEQINFANELRCLQILERFPKGCCKISAMIFLYYLKNYNKVAPENLYLLANAEITKDITHAWSKVNEYHVDLTGDQFGKNRVIVEKENPWLGIYRVATEYHFEEEEFSEPYEQDVIRICTYITS